MSVDDVIRPDLPRWVEVVRPGDPPPGKVFVHAEYSPDGRKLAVWVPEVRCGWDCRPLWVRDVVGGCYGVVPVLCPWCDEAHLPLWHTTVVLSGPDERPSPLLERLDEFEAQWGRLGPVGRAVFLGQAFWGSVRDHVADWVVGANRRRLEDLRSIVRWGSCDLRSGELRIGDLPLVTDAEPRDLALGTDSLEAWDEAAEATFWPHLSWPRLTATEPLRLPA